MPIQYARTFKGEIADSTAKQSSTGLPPAQVAPMQYKTILNGLYTDISTLLSVSIQIYITSSAKVNFTPVPTPIVIAAPVVLAPLIPLAQISGVTVDTKAKAQTSALSPSQALQVAPIVYAEFCNAVFTDLNNILSTAVSTSLNTALVIAPAGEQAPPVTATLAPVPALLSKPFIPAALKALLMQNGFNEANAKTLGQTMAIQSQAKTKSLPPSATNVGAIIWETILDLLEKEIVKVVSLSVMNYIIQSGPSWSIPAGVPGAPLIPPAMVPTMSGPMPAANLCIP